MSTRFTLKRHLHVNKTDTTILEYPTISAFLDRSENSFQKGSLPSLLLWLSQILKLSFFDPAEVDSQPIRFIFLKKMGGGRITMGRKGQERFSTMHPPFVSYHYHLIPFYCSASAGLRAFGEVHFLKS